MALTFSMEYKNTPEDFQQRVLAQLQAQSIAISAALALAAQAQGRHANAIDHQLVRIKEAQIPLPVSDRDRAFAEQHLNEIFGEAKKILAVQFPFDK
ncbi:hypothetical protein [Herbaspirillum sp. BH-1]|uniref:hypothetical protein n=1 Tax=Herbaspirillum sp. (strain BH-1) TaxID=2058884 RepID=UPI000C88CD06|nr:hypothetical protein [Herbaspirillum sp. BH-1]